jgi:hypothetical protein
MSDWTPLRAALKRCRQTQTAVPIWWRDDDAIAPTPALDQLTELSDEIGVPIYLAVIPKSADESLAAFVRGRANIIPCIHGWSHISSAPVGAKNSEFGVSREGGFPELGHAKTRMSEMFGDDLFPMFVPPWNRLDASFHPALVENRYNSFSTFGPRRQPTPLPQINTHIDPIFWRGHRGLADTTGLIQLATDILNARCDREQDASEPLGLLTHHLVHVPEVWDFSAAFMSEMLNGGAHPANLKETLK